MNTSSGNVIQDKQNDITSFIIVEKMHNRIEANFTRKSDTSDTNDVPISSIQEVFIMTQTTKEIISKTDQPLFLNPMDKEASSNQNTLQKNTFQYRFLQQLKIHTSIQLIAITRIVT